jgi:kynurenine formamidase
MQIIDLSHQIETGMPVYPGTEPPVIETPVTIEADGFLEKKLTLFSHTGTHVDAPAHIIPGAMTLDRLGIDRFIGPAFIIDVSNRNDSVIKKEMLIPLAEKLRKTDFVLFYSGWSSFWGNQKYFIKYPVLSEEAAHWICQFELKGIGVDMCSFDPVDSTELPVHHVLLRRGFILIENLTNLADLPEKSFTFSCLPLKIESSDGAPTRAVAILS